MQPSIENHPTPARKIYDVEQVTSHIVSNVIKKSPETLRGRKCGDGRDRSSFIEAIFGSDLGYVFAAQSALRSLEKIDTGKEKDVIQATFEAVADSGQIFIHTDKHHGNEATLIGGCGANGVARRNLDGFGITDTDIEALDEVLATLDSQGKVEKDIYEGDHIEGAVLVVHGRDYGVRAMDVKNNTSVFIVQKDLVEDRFKQIAKNLSQKFDIEEGLLLERLLQSWNTHTGIIGGELAKLPDGTPLPTYQVAFDEQGKPVVSQ